MTCCTHPVRRPGHSIYDAIGTNDMTTDDVYYERGINLRHGYLCETYVDDATFIVPLPESLLAVGVLLEPLTVVREQGTIQVYAPEAIEVVTEKGLVSVEPDRASSLPGARSRW